MRVPEPSLSSGRRQITEANQGIGLREAKQGISLVLTAEVDTHARAEEVRDLAWSPDLVARRADQDGY